jgi:hypothetical protein
MASVIHKLKFRGWRCGQAGYRRSHIRIERLTERAISFALAEVDEDLAVARLAFLAQNDHAALDAAIDACLARTERTLYTRWRAPAGADQRPRALQAMGGRQLSDGLFAVGAVDVQDAEGVADG